VLLRVALPLALVFFGSFSSVFAEDPKTSVSQALKGLNQKTRFARGLEDQCVDVYEDLEMRARKAGQDYLHNDVANWHHVKNQDRRLDLIASELTKQENEFSTKYQNDVIGLSANLQLLEPIKAKKEEILTYQTDLTEKILQLNDLASKITREKFYTEIKFLAKTNMPCLKAIYSRWETSYKELKDPGDGSGENKVELKEENESKLEVVKREVEGALKIYEEKIIQLFKLGQNVPELKIKLKDAGFKPDGSMNELQVFRKARRA